MKTILFLAVIAIYCLSSCEKNYSCFCHHKLEIDGIVYSDYDYIAWNKNITKNKAKSECNSLDSDGLPSGWETTECEVYQKKIKDASNK